MLLIPSPRRGRQIRLCRPLRGLLNERRFVPPAEAGGLEFGHFLNSTDPRNGSQILASPRLQPGECDVLRIEPV